MEVYYSCCGKSICGGFVNSDAEKIGNMMRRVDSNDAGAMDALGTCCYNGELGLQEYHTKAIELWIRAAELGFSKSHNSLGMHYYNETKEWELWNRAYNTNLSMFT
jgi:TPR repeat protein